jgi:probable F420-dependent oxidoreductase
MKIGLNLDNRGPGATPENMVHFAVTADRLGFSSLVVSDHIVLVHQQTNQYPYSATGEIDFDAWTPWHDTLGLIGFVAGKTARIRLGPSVLILPYRNPLVIAKWCATVDALSGGRLFLGAGTGWWREEFDALGLGDQFAERGPRTDEYLRICKNLWAEARPAYQGQFFSYANLIAAPKPVQPGGIPIWIGGNSRRALRRVADLGDVWHPVVLTPPADLNPMQLGEQRKRLESLYEERDRDPATVQIAPKTHVYFTPDRSRLLTGTPQHIVEDLLAYQAQGVGEFIFYVPGASAPEKLDNLQRIAEEILPQVAR